MATKKKSKTTKKATPARKAPTAYTTPAAARTAKKTVSSKPTTKATTTSAAKKTSRYVSEIGAKTIAAQQKLSNQHGVATFSHTKSNYGKISTVPTARSGGFSDINVGIGSYKDFDTFANEAIRIAVDQEKTARQVGAGITVNDSGQFVPSYSADDPIIVADPYSPTRYVDLAASMEANKPILTDVPPEAQMPSNFSTAGITNFLEQHGTKIGLGLAAFLIVMALVKKKW